MPPPCLDLSDPAELVGDVLVPVEVPDVDAEGVLVDPVHVQDELLVPLGRQRPRLVVRSRKEGLQCEWRGNFSMGGRVAIDVSFCAHKTQYIIIV